MMKPTKKQIDALRRVGELIYTLADDELVNVMMPAEFYEYLLKAHDAFDVVLNDITKAQEED